MENLIDAFTGFLITSSALLLVLGALSGIIIYVFKIIGKARLLICSMLMIMPVIYPIESLIPDHHKVPLPSEKLQAILPASLEPGINTFTYDGNRSVESFVSPTVTTAKSETVKPSNTQTTIPDLYRTTSVALTWKQAITGIWILLFVFILMRSFFFLRKTRHLIKYADRVTDPAVLAVLHQCRKETGLRRIPRLLAVDHTLTPMAVGFLQPAVIIPSRLLMPEFHEGLRFTLLHELKHLQRCDNWWLLVESLVGAVYFFHPVIYWAKRKIHEEWEQICDRHVVQITNKPASYADFLLHEIWNHGRQMNTSMSVPLIFKSRKTTKRVHSILQKMSPTLLMKIRDRIAVSTVFVCFISVFLCTVTPSANVNEYEVNRLQADEIRFMVKGIDLSTTEGMENRESVSIENDSVSENREIEESKDELILSAEIEHTGAATNSGAAELFPQEKVQDTKFESPHRAEKENATELLPKNAEEHRIDTESLPSALTGETGIPEDEAQLPNSETLFETSDLLVTLDPGSLLASPQLSQDVLVSADEKTAEQDRNTAREAENHQQDRSGTDMKDDPSSENVSIPMGARIFDWKVIDERTIIIMTRFYGSFKATLAEDHHELSDYKKKLRFTSNWPYELDENSSVILPNKEVKIQGLVPYNTKHRNFISLF